MSGTTIQTTVSLPNETELTYPIKITQILVNAGDLFFADKTPIYSVMDAKGAYHTMKFQRSGKIVDLAIKIGDIYHSPAGAFDVEYNTEPPKPEPSAKPTPKLKSSGVKGMLIWCIGAVMVGSLGMFLLKHGSIYNARNAEYSFEAFLRTELYFFGTSAETNAGGTADVFIPTSPEGATPVEYKTLTCPLSQKQYSFARNNRATIGDTSFVNWVIWRGKLTRELYCDLASSQGGGKRSNGDPIETQALLNLSFLQKLKEHDANTGGFW